MKRTAIALAFALLAGSASANVLLDFNNVGSGASVNDFYNGGTDSLGNAGVNYGIHFSGGTVTNGRISGPFTITFDANADLLRLDLQAARTGEGGYMVYSTRYGTDFNFRDPTINPNCNSQAACDARHMVYIPNDQLFSDRLLFEPGMGVYKITLDNYLTDNLLFTSATWNGPASDPVTAAVPEPTTLALLGLGALGLIRRRKA